MGACRPGHTRVLSGLFLIKRTRGPDAKTRGHQHIVYACTDVRKAYSAVTKPFCGFYIFPLPPLSVHCPLLLFIL